MNHFELLRSSPRQLDPGDYKKILHFLCGKSLRTSGVLFFWTPRPIIISCKKNFKNKTCAVDTLPDLSVSETTILPDSNAQLPSCRAHQPQKAPESVFGQFSTISEYLSIVYLQKSQAHYSRRAREVDSKSPGVTERLDFEFSQPSSRQMGPVELKKIVHFQ